MIYLTEPAIVVDLLGAPGPLPSLFFLASALRIDSGGPGFSGPEIGICGIDEPQHPGVL
jgi:hypothetical protein